MSQAAYDSAVASWREHLRAGGATAWTDFRHDPQPNHGSSPGPAGAVQLELVRRLESATPNFADLAELVLSTPAPGRGSIDVPLSWQSPRPYGAPDVDPADLAADELVRVATGVLDRLLPVAESAQPDRRKPLLGKGFEVAGAPVAVRLAREAMRAKGWRERSRRSRRFVFGAPLADGMAQVWSSRVDAGAAVTWRELWRRTTRRGLPVSLRFEELVATPGRTIAVKGTLDEIAQTMGRDHGVEFGLLPDLVATELTRRLNPVLAMRMSRDERRAVAPAVRELVEARGADRKPVWQLGVPARARAWAAHIGGDYAQNPMVDVPDDAVLELALAAIARAWIRRLQGSD